MWTTKMKGKPTYFTSRSLVPSTFFNIVARPLNGINGSVIPISVLLLLLLLLANSSNRYHAIARESTEWQWYSRKKLNVGSFILAKKMVIIIFLLFSGSVFPLADWSPQLWGGCFAIGIEVESRARVSFGHMALVCLRNFYWIRCKV